ncbi:MAG TPA: HAMP domain-containing sensor histidine kinase [Candidatus Dormibacteraeota bacterium]|nr:HAMP domain-containing sensor histidine kinase [Candidatus Dormibacteraeota bacterium]
MRAGAGPPRWRGWDYDQWPFTMRRPPWWPEGEPFPPRRRFRRGPRPWLRFVGCFVLAVFGLAFLTGGFLGALFGGPGPGPGPHPPFFLLPILVVIALIVIATAGGVRRMTRPMDNLIDAARRIEAGDYSAQVPEWGSPDIQSVARAFNSMSARLKAADEQRRSFLADVTHELRTPLSVIRGQAEAINDGLYPADAAHLAPILDATAALDRLVEDLRTLVLTDAGNLVLHKEPTDIGALVRDTVESFRAQAESKGLSLSTDIAPGLPTIEVDPARIRQVIGNLLSNAIRHTPSGGSVKVGVEPAGDQMTINVTDTGDGIPPELLPHVFERFVKGADSTGSGLGLAIARDIVKAHGGSVSVSNQAPSGTSAGVSLPIS